VLAGLNTNEDLSPQPFVRKILFTAEYRVGHRMRSSHKAPAQAPPSQTTEIRAHGHLTISISSSKSVSATSRFHHILYEQLIAFAERATHLSKEKLADNEPADFWFIPVARLQ
jgi:hypothetical protein